MMGFLFLSDLSTEALVFSYKILNILLVSRFYIINKIALS